MENLFGILNQEMYYGEVLISYEELKKKIERYIDYYNNERI
ncbi:IS3 family transposase [Lysinibacillus sp. NPDC059133]